MKGRLVKEEQALGGMQRSRQAFLAVWQANRRRSGAARVIQRHFRASRVARLLRRTDQDAKVSLSCIPILFCRTTVRLTYKATRSAL